MSRQPVYVRYKQFENSKTAFFLLYFNFLLHFYYKAGLRIVFLNIQLMTDNFRITACFTTKQARVARTACQLTAASKLPQSLLNWFWHRLPQKNFATRQKAI